MSPFSFVKKSLKMKLKKQIYILTLCLVGSTFSCGDSEPKPVATSTEQSSAVKTSQPAANTDQVKIFLESTSVKSGEEVCLNVKVDNFVDIVSMQYSTTWNPEHLIYKGVKNMAIKDLQKESFNQPKGETNSMRFLWMSMDLSPVSLYNGSSIYQVCFEAVGKSGITTEVKIADQPITIEVVNTKYQKVPHATGAAQVTIE